jgi:hypothetical protein
MVSFLPPLAAALVLALTASGARAGAPTAKECVAECNEARAGCSAEVAESFAGRVASCVGAEDEKDCKRVAKRFQKAGKKACKGARKACKRCCKQTPGSCVQEPELPLFSGSFELPEREALETALEEGGFPPGPEGRGYTILELPDGVLYLDPSRRTPVSAAGECADAMLACFAPPERNAAGCFAMLATCKGKPWKGNAPVCCPSACGERYQALRREGLGVEDALAAAIWLKPTCMPGLEGHVEPEP